MLYGFYYQHNGNRFHRQEETQAQKSLRNATKWHHSHDSILKIKIVICQKRGRDSHKQCDVMVVYAILQQLDFYRKLRLIQSN